jgi:GNAT superfamily N-acetyltransferase
MTGGPTGRRTAPPASRIDAAQPADAAAIADLLVASITALCGPDHGHDPARVRAWTANKTAARAAQWIADPAVTVLVSRVGPDVAAVGAFRGDAVLLNYVAPAHRFAGHSKALLAEMESLMTKAGIARGRLTSTATAHPFYTAAGWRDVEDTPSAEGREGHAMVKELAR